MADYHRCLISSQIAWFTMPVIAHASQERKPTTGTVRGIDLERSSVVCARFSAARYDHHNSVLVAEALACPKMVFDER